MGMTSYFETQILNSLKGVSFTAKSSFVGLFTTPPNDIAPGTEITDPKYSRIAISDMEMSTPLPVGGTSVIENTKRVVFPEASMNWPRVTHFGIFNSITGGQMLLYGELSESITVYIGDVLEIPARRLRVAME